MDNNSVLKLMVVDDEPEAHRQISKYIKLDFKNIEIIEAANGSDALKSADSWKPNVIVSDINMPIMDGLELVWRVKKMIPKAQVIICTGREDHDAPISALRSGASDYITKPLNMDELSIAISRAQKQKENPADLIITDIIMPEEGGLETIMKIKRDYPETKIIAISGGGRIVQVDFLAIAKSLGVVKTMQKPLERTELLQTVKEALELN